jgi:hypothetical protein
MAGEFGATDENNYFQAVRIPETCRSSNEIK